jgi:hypothetical protein
VGSETGRRTPKIESIRNVVLARCGSGTRWRDTLTGHIVGILCASSIGSEIGQLAVATVDVYHCGALRARCGCRLGPNLRKRPTIPAAEPINPPWVVDIENRFAGEERENLRLKKVEPLRLRCKTCRTGARCVELGKTSRRSVPGKVIERGLGTYCRMLSLPSLPLSLNSAHIGPPPWASLCTLPRPPCTAVYGSYITLAYYQVAGLMSRALAAHGGSPSSSNTAH